MFGLSNLVLANGVYLKRACLDDLNNRINLEFVTTTDCDSIEVVIYGERSNGAGFRIIGSSDVIGLNNISLDAENSNNWKIYLVYIDKCKGDTIIGKQVFVDSTPPQGVGIDSVSVVGDSVLIGWSESTSKDIKDYVLYYDKKGGLSELLDTIDLSLFYYENSDSIDANSSNQTYRIAAFDSCGISTGQVDAHSTVYLKSVNIDYCDRNITLERTNYRGWEDDEISYLLVYKPEGQNYWSPLSAFDFNDLFKDLVDYKENFEIKVRVINKTKGFTASSNSIKILFGDDRALDTFYIYSVRYFGNSTQLSWKSSKTDLVEIFNLEFSDNGVNDWAEIKKIDANSGGAFSIDLDNSIRDRFYRLSAVSACQENIGFSNSVKVCGLDISVPDLNFKYLNKELEKERLLNWDKFINWNSSTTEYLILRDLGSGYKTIGITADTFYLDTESLTDVPVDSGICYKIVGREIEPYLSSDTGKVETNELCYFFDFHMDLPTAFVFSKEEEKIFNIPIENLDSVNSYLKIYNRWGELVLDNSLSWNGGVNNNASNPCPEGLYFYIGRVQLKNRQFYFISKSLQIFR